MTPLEIAAALTAMVGIGLAVRGSVWSWPWNLVSSALYLLFFGQEKLYADAALQLAYLALGGVGWWQWAGGTSRGNLAITRAPRAELLLLAAATAATAAAWGWLLAHYTDAAVPWIDSALTALSLAGQWLLMRKRIENWLVWLVADAAYVVLYAVRGYWPTVALFSILIGLAVLGWRQWRRTIAPIA